MTDEYRSLSLNSSAQTLVSNNAAEQPFGQPVRTYAAGHDLDADTFALWRFNETEDLTEALNYAQSVTATYSTRALDFGGTDEYVTMGNVLDKEYTDAFSISCWARFSPGIGNGYLVSKMAATPQGYGLIAGDTYIRFNLFSTGAIGVIVDTNTAFDDDQWHHIVVTYSGNGLASGVTIYVDGSAQATTTSQDNLASNSISNAASFNLGSRTDGSVVYVGGLDEVTIHNRVLTSAEVTTLYNGGVPTDPRTLTFASTVEGYWPCGDGDTYPTLTDNSNSGNDGTMTNMETTDITREVPAGYMLQPTTTSSWNTVPPASYASLRGQHCRWFRGSYFSSNLNRVAAESTEIQSVLLGDHTVEVWVYIDDLTESANHTVIECSGGTGDTGDTLNYLQRVIIQSDGKINIFWEHDSGVNEGFTTTSAYITSGTWYHLAVTNVVATGNRTVKIYVDGDYKEQHTATNASGGSLASFRLGLAVDSSNKLYGALSDFRLSNVERTASEIAVSASDYRHLVDADTFALWRLDEAPPMADEARNLPLMAGSFTDGPGIVWPLIPDGGKARGMTNSIFGAYRESLLDLFRVGEVTIEIWFCFTNDATTGSFTPGGVATLFQIGGSGEASKDNIVVQMQLQTDLTLRNFWESGAGTNHEVVTSNPVLETMDLWVPHHLVMTQSYSNSTIQFYVDGELVEEFTGLTAPTGGEDGSLSIYDTAEPFAIDDVRISSKIRTAQEIAASYARGRPQGRVTWYRKRARDSGALTTTYVTWKTTDPDGAYSGLLPGGGPLVDEVILDEFQV